MWKWSKLSISPQTLFTSLFQISDNCPGIWYEPKLQILRTFSLEVHYTSLYLGTSSHEFSHVGQLFSLTLSPRKKNVYLSCFHPYRPVSAEKPTLLFIPTGLLFSNIFFDSVLTTSYLLWSLPEKILGIVSK